MEEPATWIARRVGAIGIRRLDVIGALRRELSMEPSVRGADVPLGLSAEELQAISATFNFAGMAAAFPSRGDVQRLRQIAWFGSALGDIACAARGQRDHEVLVDAAIFNLAVALFDTAVDDQPHLLPAITRTLNPQSLKATLFGDESGSAAGQDGHEGVEGLRSLFQHVARRAGRRFAGVHVKLTSLDAFVRLMFESETDDGACRARAKTLPVTFIGALASPVVFPSRLFAGLGAFLALYDDWQDLGHDVAEGRANSFVQLVDAEGWGALSYWPRVALALGSPRRIVDHLIRAERAVLSAAKASGPTAEAKTRALIGWLLAPA